MTTKGEFLVVYNTANFLAENSFTKLGLTAKKYCNAFKEDYEALALEETYEVRAPFYLKVDGKVSKNDKGAPIVDESKEKELSAALSAWKKQPIELTGTFTPITTLLPKALMISPAIFDTINGHVINIDEEVYLEIVGAELEKESKA